MAANNKSVRIHKSHFCKYESPKTIKLVHGYVRWNTKKLKLVHIPSVLVQLFILFINQWDAFINPNPRLFRFTTINSRQTAMRNAADMQLFREVYGQNLIYLEHATFVSWRVEINNIPFDSVESQLRIGICSTEKRFNGGPLNKYFYYGMDNKFDCYWNHLGNVDDIIQKSSITDDFIGKTIMKGDIIKIQVIKWNKMIYLHFYVNDKHCITYITIKDVPYRLFISSKTLFTCCSLKHYQIIENV